MNWPTPYPMTTSVMLGGDAASRVTLPRVPVHGRAPPALAAPEPVEEPEGITGIGGGGAAWPGEWTVLRDEARQRSTVIWQGKTAVSYPSGRFDHSEKLTYDVDDAHPDMARVQGDSEYVQALQDHVLSWRGRLDVSSDAQTFFYSTRAPCCGTAWSFGQEPGRSRFHGTISERMGAAAALLSGCSRSFLA